MKDFIKKIINPIKNMSAKKKIIIGSAVGLFLAIIIFLTVLVCDGDIYSGITVSGVDLGGMSVESAKNTLSSEDFYNSDISFTCNGREFKISPTDIELKCDAEKTAQKAYEYGRNTNVFSRIGTIFGLMFNGSDLPIDISYNEEKLTAILDEQIGDLRTPSVETQFRVDGDKLYIKNGSQGLDVNKDKFMSDLIAGAKQDGYKMDLVIETVNPTPISAQALHDTYAKPVVEASYTISNMRVSYTESQDGIDFDIAAADKIIADNTKNSQEYFIPLTITPPQMTTEALDKSLFGECLGTYTTKYNPGEVGRTKNVTLAARSINNIVLNKNDVFSYNNIVGERSAARGFADAKVYAGGEVVDGLGGGICQVSSTLYNAVLLADLEVVTRTCHSLPVAYVPLGRDATVSYGTIDFKFKNQYDFPVKVTSSVGGGTLTVSVYGKRDTEKKVEISTQYVNTIPFSVIEKPDPSIAEGKTKVKQSGSNGAVVNTYKKVTENGMVTYNKMIHTSRYSPINKVVLVPPVAEEPVTPPEGFPVEPPVETPPAETSPVEVPPVEDVPAETSPAVESTVVPTEDTPVENQ